MFGMEGTSFDMDFLSQMDDLDFDEDGELPEEVMEMMMGGVMGGKGDGMGYGKDGGGYFDIDSDGNSVHVHSNIFTIHSSHVISSTF